MAGWKTKNWNFSTNNRRSPSKHGNRCRIYIMDIPETFGTAITSEIDKRVNCCNLVCRSRKMGFDESPGWVPAGEQESLDDSRLNARKAANLRYSSGTPMLMHIA